MVASPDQLYLLSLPFFKLVNIAKFQCLHRLIGKRKCYFKCNSFENYISIYCSFYNFFKKIIKHEILLNQSHRVKLDFGSLTRLHLKQYKQLSIGVCLMFRNEIKAS